MDADGNNLRNLTNHPGEDWHPAWSPDGQRIAFGSSRDEGVCLRLYTMDADGNNQRNLHLVEIFLCDECPAWSPDGQRIVTESCDPGQRDEICVWDADGNNPRNLTKNPATNDRNPKWSPDGRKIAFNSERDGNDEIYIMDADGMNPRNLTNHPARDRDPDWFDPAFAYSVSPASKLKGIWGWVKESRLW